MKRIIKIKNLWHRLNLYTVQSKLFDLSILKRYRHWVIRRVFHTVGRGLSIGHNVEMWSLHNQNNVNLVIGDNVKIDANVFIDLAGKVMILFQEML